MGRGCWHGILLCLGRDTLAPGCTLVMTGSAMLAVQQFSFCPCSLTVPTFLEAPCHVMHCAIAHLLRDIWITASPVVFTCAQQVSFCLQLAQLTTHQYNCVQGEAGKGDKLGILGKHWEPFNVPHHF